MITVALVAVAVVGTAVGTYLFLRNNPQKASVINSAVSTTSADVSKAVNTVKSAV